LVADFQREYFDELQIQFQPGVGFTGLSDVTASTIPGAQYLGDNYTIAAAQTFLIGVTQTDIIGTSSILTSVTTQNPQAMLKWSNDGGSTWSKGILGKYWFGWTVQKQGYLAAFRHG